MFEACLERRVVNLLIKGRMVATFCIYIVREQIISVVDTSNGRVGVSITVRMESWLPEVRRECRVSEPPG